MLPPVLQVSLQQGGQEGEEQPGTLLCLILHLTLDHLLSLKLELHLLLLKLDLHLLLLLEAVLQPGEEVRPEEAAGVQVVWIPVVEGAEDLLVPDVPEGGEDEVDPVWPVAGVPGQVQGEEVEEVGVGGGGHPGGGLVQEQPAAAGEQGAY